MGPYLDEDEPNFDVTGGFQPTAPQAPAQPSPFDNLNPLVAQYMKNKMSVKDAQESQDRTDMLGLGVKLGDAVINSQLKPTIFENRMQDLGSAPKIQQAGKINTDISGLQAQAKHKLDTARSDESDAVRQAFEQKKAELMQQIQAKKAEEEARRFNLNYAQKDRDIASQAKSRQAYADAMMGLKKEGLDLQRQKLESANGIGGLGKPISGELASKISGYDAADTIINDLEKDYDEKASGKGSWLMSQLPGTDANSYKSALRPKIQALGTALEGGKLTDADFSKYEAMIPGPGTFPDQKTAMIKALRDSLKAKRDAEANTLQGAGYRVPPSASAAPSKVTVSNGTETLEIDASDLAHAEQDGYKRIK